MIRRESEIRWIPMKLPNLEKSTLSPYFSARLEKGEDPLAIRIETYDSDSKLIGFHPHSLL